MLRDSVVVVVVVVRTRPRAIPLAMITMRKSAHGFPFVSPIWVAYGAPLGGPSGRRSSAIRDLQIGLRVRDRVRVRFSNFKPVTFPEPSFFMLVLDRESSSRDEIGLCCDNVKPEN